MLVITVEANNQHLNRSFELARLRAAAEAVLAGEGIQSAHLSLAIVDDPTSRRLNQRYLSHDYPTDVLSFPLEQDAQRLEGEIIVSADTAHRVCQEFGWDAEDELVLYVIHGVLHLTGYDDHSESDRRKMRQREAFYLTQLGLSPRQHEGA